VKIVTLPKASYMFNAIPIKILMAFFHKDIKINPKEIPQITKVILSKKSNAVDIMITSDFKVHRAIVIKNSIV
jgi:hypothetical protein